MAGMAVFLSGVLFGILVLATAVLMAFYLSDYRMVSIERVPTDQQSEEE